MEKTIELNRPNLNGAQHPVEASEYIMDTDVILETKQKIEGWIRSKLPGAIIYGEPRLGKTYAIKYIKRILSTDEALDVPIFSFCCRNQLRVNESNFFSYLLKDLGHDFFEDRNVVKKRDRVFKIFLNAGLESSRRQVVLFIDDAQLLLPDEYRFLMDIFNELDGHDIKLTTILVGQKELKFVRNAMRSANQKQIVGRFMIQQYAFSGVTNVDSLAYMLSGYDEVSEFPEGSGCSFTNYYFPLGFSKGKRLEDSAEEIMKVFTEIHMKFNRQVSINIPMFYMTNIINEVMRKYGFDGRRDEWVDIKQWRAVIKNAGYIEFIEEVEINSSDAL